VAWEQSTELFGVFAGGIELFGEEAGLQLARLLGELTARLADALVSSFIVAIGGPSSRRDPTLLELAQANTQAASLMPPFIHAFDVLLRHHLEVARRPLNEVMPALLPNYESRQIAVGFADLTGSTALAGRVTFAELGAALSDFESLSADIVNDNGGRVVKLIGDEVMFSAPSIAAACAIACQLVETIDADDTLPSVRAGIAAGEVLARYGDLFGPVVNLAARLVAQAEPCVVLAPAALAADIEATRTFAARPAGAVTLRGFDDDVEIVRVTRS
jgi:adenylate cyclase